MVTSNQHCILELGVAKLPAAQDCDSTNDDSTLHCNIGVMGGTCDEVRRDLVGTATLSPSPPRSYKIKVSRVGTTSFINPFHHILCYTINDISPAGNEFATKQSLRLSIALCICTLTWDSV
jgi:hypothetical protein